MFKTDVQGRVTDGVQQHVSFVVSMKYEFFSFLMASGAHVASCYLCRFRISASELSCSDAGPHPPGMLKVMVYGTPPVSESSNAYG